jgi:hypothetical protein
VLGQVLFLHEDAIVEEVCAAIQSRLLNANASRTFLTQVQTLSRGESGTGD